MSPRPRVVLKAALTLDGKLATRSGDSRWITSKASRVEAHRLRAEADAVMVGVGTALADDPWLNVRHVEGRDPERVVVDSTLRTPPIAKVVAAPGGATTIVHGPDASADRKAALVAAGATLLEVARGEGGLDLEEALGRLRKRGIASVLVEGGARLHGALLDAGLADRAELFLAPKIVGDAAAPSWAGGRGQASMAEAWRLEEATVRVLGADVWWSGTLRRSSPNEDVSSEPGLSPGPDED
ncbi:MAG: RibD family protein [Myxococcota bacterium]